MQNRRKLSDDPFSARYERNNLGCHEAANERAYCNGGYGGNGWQRQDGLEHRNPQTEPEDVHQIHTVAEFRDLHDEPRSFRKFNATEHQERACREKHTVDRAESPPYFQYGRGKDFPRYGLDIERVDGQSRPDDHRNGSDNETFGAVPGQMDMYVMCEHEIA